MNAATKNKTFFQIIQNQTLVKISVLKKSGKTKKKS